MKTIDTRPALVFFSLLAIMMLLPASAMRTHAFMIDLHPIDPADRTLLTLPADRVAVTSDDYVTWNSRQLDLGTLLTELRQTQVSAEARRLIFHADGKASYDRVVKVLRVIKESGRVDDRFCISGLAQYREFEKSWRHSAMRLTILLDPSKQLQRPLPEALNCDPLNDAQPKALSSG